MSNVIKLEGFDKFKNKVAQLQINTERFADAKVLDAAKKWEGLAKQAAPVDQSSLRRGIVGAKTALMTAEVVSQASHSRFIEFGTKKKKFVPADLAGYESSLTYTKTGDYYDFLQAILAWVKRKGIGVTYNVATRRKNRQSRDEYLGIAQAIANSIMRNGVSPQPFFFQHKKVVERDLIKDVQDYLNKEQ